MAYIKNPADEEQQQGTMNTLGGNTSPQGTQQTSPEAQNTPINISGQQSASVGAGPSQPSTQAKKGVGSGQYTNVKKYIDANKGATSNLAQSATQDFTKRAQSVGQAVQKKQDQLNQGIQQNQQSLGQAKQFGQTTLNSAQNQQDMSELQKRQEEYQKRLQSLQNTQDRTNEIGQYQTDLDARKQALQGMQSQYTTNQDTFKTATNDLNAARAKLDIPSYSTEGSQGYDWMFGGGDQQAAQIYQKKFELDLTKGRLAQNTEYGGRRGRSKQSDLNTVARLEQELAPYFEFDKLNQQTLDSKQNVAKSYEDIINEQKALGGTESQLATAQDQQNLFARRQALEGELAGLTEKIQNAPSELTNEDVQRYRDLVEGRERYDQLSYDQAREQMQGDDLNKLAQGVEREDVRRQLLQQAFGKQGDYTRGEVALDDLLLKGSPEAAQALVQGVQGTSQSLQDQLRNARRMSLQGIAGLRQGQTELQNQLGEGATSAIQGLESEIDQRVASGEGTRLDAIRNALSEGVISAEQAQLLGIEQGRTYGVDLGQQLSDLSGVATRGNVSSRSDLARAQALSRLAGMTEQSIFVNPDTVGQMSEAEKFRLAEIQGELARGRRDYEQTASDAAYNAAIARGGSGDERNYKTQNTNVFNQQLQNLINQKGTENITEQDLQNINNNMLLGRYGNYAYGAKWGLGDTIAATSGTQAQLDAMKQNQRQFAVEGADVAAERQSEVQRQQQLEARRRIMEALAQTGITANAAHGLFGHQGFYATPIINKLKGIS